MNAKTANLPKNVQIVARRNAVVGFPFRKSNQVLNRIVVVTS